MDRETALEKLEHPAEWCAGARTLARLGNRADLLPLIRAYESPVEVGKVCLLDAMDTLGAEVGAHALYQSDSAEQRRLAVHLMELFPTDVHLPLLERAVVDPSAAVRRQARRALRCQLQTPAWEATLARLLDADDVDARAQAIAGLSRRRSDLAREALQARLATETDPVLREQIKRALETMSRH